MNIKISITRSKIDQSLVVKKGDQQYLNCILFQNREKDQYGNDGIIKQEASKEERARREASGEKIPIIGNWKIMPDTAGTPAPNTAAIRAGVPEVDQDTPF